MKLKKLRLLFDDCKSLLNFNYFNITTNKSKTISSDTLFKISQSELIINWREELGEINLNRIQNITLGSELVNNIILKPNQILSLRYLWKDASNKQGFKEGPMFKNGKIHYVTGGGLCLVSTIIFDAALKANLLILEKHNHSTDLWGEDRFIELGRDATYVHGLKDLKIKNNFNSDVVFKVWVEPDNLRLKCEILSEKQLDRRIEIQQNILKELLPVDISKNSKCDINYRKGWVVETKRVLISSKKEQTTYCKIERYNPFKMES